MSGSIRAGSRGILALLLFVSASSLYLSSVKLAMGSTYQSHTMIYITGNAGFTTANGVTGGSGTPSDPFIIEGWDINVSGSSAGIAVHDSDVSFIIRNNYIHAGSSIALGIELTRVSSAVVANNIVLGNDFGIGADTSRNVTVTRNTVTSTGHYGIYLFHSNYSFVTGNDVSLHSNAGIVLDSSTQDTVRGNNVHNQTYMGIDTYQADRNIIVANNVSYNGWFGIRLYLSNYNLVYHNNLVWNHLTPIPNSPGGQVMDSPTGIGVYDNQNTTNRWDDGYPIAGNYYAPFTTGDYCAGPSQGSVGCGGPPWYSDGISDGRYQIPDEFNNNTYSTNYFVGFDYYPLFTPFSSATILPDFKVDISPSQLNVSQGSSGVITVTVTSVHNFTDSLTISVSTNAPPSILSWTPQSGNLGPSGTFKFNMTANIGSSAPIGTYNINVTITSASIPHETETTLTTRPVAPQPQGPGSNPPPPPCNCPIIIWPWLALAPPLILAAAIAMFWRKRQTRSSS